MRRYEWEALLKSFSLFFLLLGALYFLFAWGRYHDRQRDLEGQIFNEMRIFAFHPTGSAFDVDFIAKEGAPEPLRLYHRPQGLVAYFPIPGSQRYLMRLTLPAEQYARRLERIRLESFAAWWLFLLLAAVVSFLLALYTLHPLKRALELNEEFVKDILHDINTPLSALRINLNLLKKRHAGERSVERMFHSLETIHSFQANLRAFLDRECGLTERFDLRELLEGRMGYFRQIHPRVEYRLEMEEPVWLECNREAMTRILENLLSNAGRYNRPGGRVSVRMEGEELVVEDTGVGIREPDRIFERFYKEGERGLGLGLHIVKKLAEAQGIGITVRSEVGVGSRFVLDLSGVMAR